MIKQYQKKPIVIEAVQWDGTEERFKEIEKFVSNAAIKSRDNNEIKLITPEGILKASVWDFIIKGVNGEYYPRKPDIFAKTYDEVDTQGVKVVTSDLYMTKPKKTN